MPWWPGCTIVYAAGGAGDYEAAYAGLRLSAVAVGVVSGAAAFQAAGERVAGRGGWRVLGLPFNIYSEIFDDGYHCARLRVPLGDRP